MICWAVSSVDPSSTTMTSYKEYSSLSSEEIELTTVTLSLYAGTMTETGT